MNAKPRKKRRAGASVTVGVSLDVATKAKLKALAAEIGGRSDKTRKVSVHRVDVSEPGNIAQFASEATATHPSLSIVVNNAGMALLSTFEEIDQAQLEWLFDINF